VNANVPAVQENVDDISFVSSIIHHSSQHFGTDPEKTLAIGYSNGGRRLNSTLSTHSADIKMGRISSSPDIRTQCTKDSWYWSSLCEPSGTIEQQGKDDPIFEEVSSFRYPPDLHAEINAAEFQSSWLTQPPTQ
jgi:poly(3-hydroxybutyrate) depolymerase